MRLLTRLPPIQLIKRCPRWLPLVACLGAPLAAQVDYATPYTFTLLAGSPGGTGSVDGNGSAAEFGDPYALAVDSSGNLYVADSKNDTIRKVTSSGVVTTIAGTAGSAGNGNATGTAAQFNTPSGVAVASGGNIYVADLGNQLIRQITPSGVVTTLAGTVATSGSTDGTGTAALFNQPYGLAVDGSGNIYVADLGNQEIRKVTSSGVVTTIAGSPGSAGSANGTGAAAQFNQPIGVAVDSSGNLYVTDSGNNTIRKITSGGVVTTLAGSPVSPGARTARARPRSSTDRGASRSTVPETSTWPTGRTARSARSPPRASLRPWEACPEALPMRRARARRRSLTCPRASR